MLAQVLHLRSMQLQKSLFRSENSSKMETLWRRVTWMQGLREIETVTSFVTMLLEANG